MNNASSPLRKVGRPARKELRKSVLTFFPQELRDAIKVMAEDSGMSTSDWFDAQVAVWLMHHQKVPVYISKTNPRRDANGQIWVAVQMILLDDTYMRVQNYALKFNVSVAGILYTIAKGLYDNRSK